VCQSGGGDVGPARTDRHRGAEPAERSWLGGIVSRVARLRPKRHQPGRQDGTPAEALLPLLYPQGAAEAHQDQLLEHLRAAHLRNVGDLRRLLGSFERQLAPSPLEVRFGREDLAEYRLGAYTLYALRDDVSVSSTVLSGVPYEPHITAVLERWCRPGMTVIDIGANIGWHTFALSQQVGAAGQVVAIEPNSENCRLIILGVLRNDIGNVTILPVALDRRQGWDYFGTHLGSNGGFLPVTTETLEEGRGVVVPTFRLDDLVQAPVDLIKIDVEGAEARVLEGATGLLRARRPVIVSEFSLEMLQRVSDCRGERYLQMIADYGYRVHLVQRPTGEELEVEIADLVSAGRPSHQIDDLVFVPSTWGVSA
jgi:FkbM family methyltransferase